MSNEDYFKCMAQSDLNYVNELVSKGYYETSDFERAILKLSDTLAMLHQAINIGGGYDCQKNWQGPLQKG